MYSRALSILTTSSLLTKPLFIIKMLVLKNFTAVKVFEKFAQLRIPHKPCIARISCYYHQLHLPGAFDAPLFQRVLDIHPPGGGTETLARGMARKFFVRTPTSTHKLLLTRSAPSFRVYNLSPTRTDLPPYFIPYSKHTAEPQLRIHGPYFYFTRFQLHIVCSASIIPMQHIIPYAILRKCSVQYPSTLVTSEYGRLFASL